MEGSQLTFVGKYVAIENGCISSREDFTAEGRICTKLISTANVIIGADAVFEGFIIAHNLEIKGEFKGDAYVKENLIIRSGSKVSGKVSASNICMEGGSSFVGQSATISQSYFDKYAMANKVYAKLRPSAREPKLLNPLYPSTPVEEL